MRVALLIAGVAAAAAVALVASAPSLTEAIAERPLLFGLLLAITLILQTLSIDLAGTGSIGVSAFGVIIAAISLGAAPAMAIAVVAALVQWIRRRGLLHRGVFDAANFALSAGAAGVVYVAVGGEDSFVSALAAGTAAGFAYTLVNNGLLCLAMSSSERRPLLAIWKERFHWALLVFVAFGPAAGLFVAASERGRSSGVLVFVLMSGLLVAGLRFAGGSVLVGGSVGRPSA